MSAFNQFSYPYFRKGQVLKNTDLNNMVDYLDQQSRFTRALVIGTGIFSGLQVDIDYKPGKEAHLKLILSQGLGLSSDGYIIQMKKDNTNDSFVYSKYRKLLLPESAFRCKNNSDNNSSESVQWKVFELIEEDSVKEQSGEDTYSLINLVEEYEKPVEYCLILWISREEKDRPFCIDICDETGADVKFSIKPLLIKKSDICRNGYASDIENESGILDPPPDLKIHPFGYYESSGTVPDDQKSPPSKVVNPSLIEDYDNFLNNYKSIISSTLDEHPNIIDACNWMYNYMKILGLEGEQNPFDSLYINLKSILEQMSKPVINPESTPQCIEIQYLYLYLHDLKRTYEEFVDVSSDIIKSIMPDLCRYPRYVGLAGLAVRDSETPQFGLNPSCRSAFQPSMFYEGNNSRIREIEFYYERMKMLTTISRNNNNGIVELPLPSKGLHQIRITPGRSRQMPLSKQSIPYYFKKNIKDYWNYNSGKNWPDPKILSYRDNDAEKVFPDNNPVLFQDDEFSFFRIEGHIGHKSNEVYDLLNIWKDQFNLPFSIKTVFLNILEMRQEKYRSVELEVLENKYTEVRQNLINYLSEFDLILPPSSDILPTRLIDFNCQDLIDWLKSPEISQYKQQKPFNPECYLYSLQMLRISYDIESEVLRDLFSFSEFAKAHPGLQHLGGVPKGGTFVLVNAYVLNEEALKFIKGSKRMQKDKRYWNMIKINLSRLNQYIEENAIQLVVGDFSLPYQYCDIDKKSRLVDPMILLLPDRFCNNDSQAYGIWLYPEGGTVKGTIDGVAYDSIGLPDYVSFDSSLGKYFFHPDQVPIPAERTMAELMISYHIGGLSAKTRVIVYMKPAESSIEMTSVPLYNEHNLLYGQKVTFTASMSEGFKSYWMIDGERIKLPEGTSPDTLQRQFNYHDKTRYLISHVVSNDVCETRTDKEILLCQMLLKDLKEGITMYFETTPSFTEDPDSDESVDIIVNPQGGQFRMKRASGEYFEPEIKILRSEDESGNISLNYKLINSVKNPLPAGQYFIIYYLPVCGLETDPHDFFVQSEPFIILKRYAFCSCDKNRYPVYIHPSDGQLVADPDKGLIREDNHYFFEPSHVIESDEITIARIKLTCTPQAGEPVTQTLAVYKVPGNIEKVRGPEPVFEGEKCLLIGYKIIFQAGAGRAERYEWQVNDETIAVFPENKPFEYIFPLGINQFVVKLVTETRIEPDDPSKFKNQPLVCHNEIIEDIKGFCPKKEDLKIEVQETENEGEYRIKVHPVGGIFKLVYDESEYTIEDLPIIKPGDNPCTEKITFYFSIWNIAGFEKIPKGSYKIVYSFPGCNLFVEYRWIEIHESPKEPRILPEQPEEKIIRGTPKTTDKREENARLLNSRIMSRRQAVEELAKDIDLAKTRTFGLANMFTLFAGNVREFHKRFHEASDLLYNSLKRTTGKRRKQFEELLEHITIAYLDKLVVSSPEKLKDEVRDALEEVNGKMKKAKINRRKLIENWEGEILKNAMDASSVDEIKRIFK